MRFAVFITSSTCLRVLEETDENCSGLFEEELRFFPRETISHGKFGSGAVQFAPDGGETESASVVDLEAAGEVFGLTDGSTVLDSGVFNASYDLVFRGTELSVFELLAARYSR